jgi:type II secretory pathway component PulF
VARKSNEEQIEELKTEAKQAWADAKALAANTTGGALGVWHARPLPAKPRAAFFRELSARTTAGLSLSQCLAGMSEVARAGSMGAIIDDLDKRTAAGAKLWIAMREHGNAFERLEITLCECGMRAGNPAPAFAVIADHLDAKAKIAHNLIGEPQKAPLVVAALFAVVVIPMSTSGFFGYVFGVVWTALGLSLGAAAVIGAWLYLRSNRNARYKLSGLLSKTKQFAEIANDRRFAELLGSLHVGLRSGLAADRAMAVALTAADDGPVRDKGGQVLAAIEQGKKLKEALALLPGLDQETAASIEPVDGDVVASIKDRADVLRDRFVARTSKIGKITHYTLAALLVVFAFSAGSSDGGAKKKRRKATAAKQRKGEALGKEGGALHKRLTGQKSADDRAKRALQDR